MNKEWKNYLVLKRKKKIKKWLYISLQSRSNFPQQILSIFLAKIMAIIFDFNGRERLGRERNLSQEGERWLKINRVN